MGGEIGGRHERVKWRLRKDEMALKGSRVVVQVNYLEDVEIDGYGLEMQKWMKYGMVIILFLE